jgi:hypothetical protein
VEVAVALHRRRARLQRGPLSLDVRVVSLEEDRVQVFVGDHADLDHLAFRLDSFFGVIGLEVHVRQRCEEAELDCQLIGSNQSLSSFALPVGPRVVLLLLKRVLHCLEGPQSAKQNIQMKKLSGKNIVQNNLLIIKRPNITVVKANRITFNK